MNQLQRVRSRPAMAIAVCGALAGAIAVADVARAETFTLRTGGGDIVPVDLGAKGKSPGDLYVFHGDVFDGAGTRVGALVGEQTSIALGSQVETVQGSVTFELADGQIVAGGLSQYPLDAAGLLVGTGYARPVLGGTGRYAGMRGTLTSTRLPDGGYEQRFDLAPAATSAPRTVEVFGGGGATQVDLGPAGRSEGDLAVIAAALTDAAGQPIGRLRGSQTQIRSADGAHVVQAQITYALRDGQIVIGGVSRQPAEGGGLVPTTAFERPVLGGTGAYAGVSGTATTTRDGSRYRTTFALRPGTWATAAQTLRLRSPGGRNAVVDLGARGKSAGDMYVFSNPLRTASGRPAGQVRGVQTSMLVENRVETVSSALTYEVHGRGQIVVGGLAAYPTASTQKTVRGPFVRPVLGGTGDFAGAHGTLRTVRRANGSYRLTFSLSGSGAP